MMRELATPMTARPAVSPPYATGGGGVVLEHQFGAFLLACLLGGEAVPLLGDEVTPSSIRFQASAVSPVDDLLIRGDSPDGSVRRVSIGVRRTPALTGGDDSSALLLVPYIRVALDHWPEMEDGSRRLGLATGVATNAVRELGELTLLARGSPDAGSFRAEVARPGRTNQNVRQRLVHLDALVDAALRKLGSPGPPDASELTWRLLTGLHVLSLRLEGADQSDRTEAVRKLQPLTRERTAAAADSLFGKLAELAGRYAPQGAEVTVSSLRRDLAGTPLAASPTHAEAWPVLSNFAERLRVRTGFRLVGGSEELELKRIDARAGLRSKLEEAATSASTLLVAGEPDVGKSALTLRVADQLAGEGIALISLSLRDLPPRTVEFESLLGGSLADVFGASATGAGRGNLRGGQLFGSTTDAWAARGRPDR
jgi:hypothetical protein